MPTLESDVLELLAWKRHSETLPGGGVTQRWVSPISELYSTATVGAVATNWQARQFPDAASTFGYHTLALPAGWGARTLTVKIWWAPSNTNTGNCLWQFIVQHIISGTTVNAAADVSTTSLSAGNGTVDRPQTVTVTLSLSGLSSTDAAQLRLGRVGDDGTDNFTGTANLLAILLSVTG